MLNIVMTNEAMPDNDPINLAELVPPTIMAAIFDMDDLMIDSHTLDMKVFEAVLGGYGVDLHSSSNPWTIDDEISMFGLKLPDMFKLFINKYGLGPDVDPERMSRQFYKRLLPVIESEPLEPMPGLIELVGKLKEKGFQMGLASSARRSKIDIVLRKLGLSDTFAAIVSGEDEIKHGKPAPDIFLEAARKLGRQPNECMAFEDAKNGIESINAAGMFSIGVHNQFSEHHLGIKQDLSAANVQASSLVQLTYQ